MLPVCLLHVVIIVVCSCWIHTLTSTIHYCRRVNLSPPNFQYLPSTACDLWIFLAINKLLPAGCGCFWLPNVHDFRRARPDMPHAGSLISTISSRERAFSCLRLFGDDGRTRPHVSRCGLPRDLHLYPSAFKGTARPVLFPSTFVAAARDLLRLGLLQLFVGLPVGLAALTAPPPMMLSSAVAEPSLAPRRPRDVHIRERFMYLALLLVMFGVYIVTLRIAKHVSALLAAVAFIVEVQLVYLCIYGLEHIGVVDGERCDWLIKHVENLCPIGNFFSPTMVLPT